VIERVRRGASYEVGHARPPKHTQFAKGCSGNPQGRPAGSKNLMTMIVEELTRPISVVENGKRTKMPKIRAAVRQALNKAMLGDFKALQQITMMLRSHETLKRVDTRATKRAIPMIDKGMTPQEAARIYQQALAGLDDES
jgi:hypothetical protein